MQPRKIDKLRTQFPRESYPFVTCEWRGQQEPFERDFQAHRSTQDMFKYICDKTTVFEVTEESKVNFYLDIDEDWKNKTMAERQALIPEMWSFLYECILAVLQMYTKSTNLPYSNIPIRIYTSFDNDELPHKFSAHIIFGITLTNIQYCHYLASQLRNGLTSSHRLAIDLGVYKKLQQLRMVYMNKPIAQRGDNPRIKRPFRGPYMLTSTYSHSLTSIPVRRPEGYNDIMFSIYQDVCDSLITPFVGNGHVEWNFNIPDVVKEKKVTSLETDDDSFIVNHCMQLLCKITGKELHELAYTPSSMNGNILILKREQASHCHMCGRVHETDNPYMLLKESHLNYDVKFVCRRAQAEGKFKTGIRIGSFSKPASMVSYDEKKNSIISYNDTSRGINKRVINEIYWKLIQISGLLNAKMTEVKEIGEIKDISVVVKEYALNEEDYIDIQSGKRSRDTLKDFGKVMFVRSPPGTGKTKKLINLIESLPGGTSVCIVIYRRSLGFKLLEALKKYNFRSYEDEMFKNQNYMYYWRTIVQIDSLHKVREAPDLLILDEITYTFHHLFDFVKFKQIVGPLLMQYITCAPYIIGMDATLTQGTIDFFKALGRTVEVIDNTYPVLSDSKIVLVSSQADLTLLLKQKLEKGEKLYLATNSKKYADILEAMFSTKYKVQNYTSDSKCNSVNGIKEEDWIKADLVIVTPTVEVGLSIEYDHFNASFGYFNSRTSTAHSAFQQMQRVRNLKDKTYYICVKQCSKSTIPYEVISDEKKLSEWVVERGETLSNIPEVLNNMHLLFKVDIPSKWKFNTSDPFFILMKEYVQRVELSRHDFLVEILKLFKTTGVQWGDWFILHVTKSQEIEYKLQYNAFAQAIKEQEIKDIATAGDINLQQYMQLRIQYPLTQPQLLSCRKFRLPSG